MISATFQTDTGETLRECLVTHLPIAGQMLEFDEHDYKVKEVRHFLHTVEQERAYFKTLVGVVIVQSGN